MTRMEGEDQDQVLKEVDVYLARGLAPNLHLLQFPVKGEQFSLNQEEVVGLRVKPSHKMFEIELGLDTRNKCFDRRKGEDIARLASDPMGRPEDQPQASMMKKQTLTSSRVDPTASHYALGLVKENCSELHLTPLESMVQFRPTFEYLNKKEPSPAAAAKKVLSKGEEADLSSQDEGEPAEDVKAITLRFAGPHEERMKKARVHSYAYLQQVLASEPWTELTYYSPESDQASAERCNLSFGSNSDEAPDDSYPIVSVASIEQYLNLLAVSTVGPSGVDEPTAPSTAVKGPSLADQLRTLMSNAKVLSFSQLLELLHPTYAREQEQVLSQLPKFSWLVRGNWVVKSETLYDQVTGPSISPVSGIPIESLRRARDYIMWLYRLSPSLSRKEIMSIVKIPEQDVMLILKQMARFNPETKTWDFLLPTDDAFIERHQEIVKRQNMLWEARHTPLERLFKSSQQKKSNLFNESTKFPSPKISVNNNFTRKRRRSHRDSNATSGTDENESSGTEVVDNSNSVRTIKREPRSPSKSPTSLRKIQNSRLANGVSETHPREHKAKVATLEINPTLDVNPNSEQKKELVKFVQEKLRTCFCVTVTELEDSMRENPACSSFVAGPCFNRKVIEQAVIEAGGFKVQNKWPQHTAPQPLYAFTKFGDQLDGIRDILVEMFAEHTRVRISMFKQKVVDKFGENNCDNMCKKLLREFCVYKSSQYYLKGTIST